MNRDKMRLQGRRGIEPHRLWEPAIRAGDGAGVPRETVGWRGSFSKPDLFLWNSFSYTAKGAETTETLADARLPG